MTVVADNLPGYMQYLDLVRDCISLFSLTPLPLNEIETQHEFRKLWGRWYAYAAEDDEQHRDDVKSYEYDAYAHSLLRDKNREYRNRNKERRAESESSTVAEDVLETASNSQETPAAEHDDQLQELDTIDANSDSSGTRLLNNVAENEGIAAFTRNARSASPDKVPAFRPRSVEVALEEVLM